VSGWNSVIGDIHKVKVGNGIESWDSVNALVSFLTVL